MFRTMRRIDRQVTAEESAHILQKCQYGVLSTVNQDGCPYGVPISYVYIDGSIYFHCAGKGYKLDNIACNNKVTFSVVGQKKTLPTIFSTSYESVIVFGTASQAEGQEKMAALLALIDKYTPDFREKGKEYAQSSGGQTTVIKITVEHMTGKVRPPQ